MSSDSIETAKDCNRYEYEEPVEDEYYCPSATARDYSPSDPWNVLGMSVRDFI